MNTKKHALLPDSYSAAAVAARIREVEALAPAELLLVLLVLVHGRLSRKHCLRGVDAILSERLGAAVPGFGSAGFSRLAQPLVERGVLDGAVSKLRVANSYVVPAMAVLAELDVVARLVDRIELFRGEATILAPRPYLWLDNKAAAQGYITLALLADGWEAALMWVELIGWDYRLAPHPALHRAALLLLSDPIAVTGPEVVCEICISVHFDLLAGSAVYSEEVVRRAAELAAELVRSDTDEVRVTRSRTAARGLYFALGAWDEVDWLDELRPSFERAAIAALRGEPDVDARWERARDAYRKSTRSRLELDLAVGIPLAVHWLRDGTSDGIARARSVIEPARKTSTTSSSALWLLGYLTMRELGQSALSRADNGPNYVVASATDSVGVALVATFAGAEVHPDIIERLVRRSESPAFWPAWLREEAAELIGRSGDTQWAETAKELRAALGMPAALASAVAPVPRWRRQLEALQRIAAPCETPAPAAGPSARIAWEVGRHGHAWVVVPKRQKPRKSGGWTKGKVYSLRSLLEDSQRGAPHVSPADAAVCARVTTEDVGWSQPRVHLPSLEALDALVGHPLVFSSVDPTVRIDVVRGRFELSVTEEGQSQVVKLVPPVSDEPIVVIEDGPSTLRVYRLDERTEQIAQVLDGDGLRVPTTATAELDELLPALAAVVPVQSSAATAAVSRPGDPRPHLLLAPRQAGLILHCRVRPLGPDTPPWKPGVGGRAVFAQVQGQPVTAERALEQEVRLALAALEAIGLEAPDFGDDAWTFLIVEAIDALELLTAIGQVGDSVVVEWSEGKKLASPVEIGANKMRLRLESSQEWFCVEGDLEVDESTFVRVTDLLALYRHSRGRFVALDEGRVIALTEDLRRALEAIEAQSQPSKHGLRLAPMAALSLEATFEEIAAAHGVVTGDITWLSWVKRLREAMRLQPLLPAPFRSVLRPYQEEGYAWMARLAHAGLGACLSDDMGLGKTVQALALLTHRASLGPALVVAPTSVASNWVDEAHRFAPTLRPILFGAGDRDATIRDAGPFDVVVITYGLLLSESDRLAGRTWATAVLDEAQSIKNSAAKRTQAALALSAQFRLITTGTPVENHLGELWTLFQFINPGLLGSRPRFDKRFVIPIERDGDAKARRQLRALIAPFVLRRTKSQVLPDLPPRTDQTLFVDLSPDERAVYESVRQTALDSLDGVPSGPPGSRNLDVLAELMRLRRSCCHPRLVLPDFVGPSAKGIALLELVQDLGENGHRALVFSQFVDHLTAIRELLDDAGVTYQYLDGATPAPERKRRVDAFQAGEGELFLISLRAGGVGLNLTAADYVIHLDPWWNPAVEDQASDRAHRIGQTRPVTVYRLVARDTVESKILDLHHHKRDLADSLLEGSHDPARLDLDALQALLRSEHGTT